MLIKHIGLLLTVLTALGIGVLSLLPARAVSTPLSLFPHADKVAHMGAYALLAVSSTCAVFPFRHPAGRWIVPAITAACAFYGLGIEVLQLFSGRSFSWLDAAANLAGACIGAVVAWTVLCRLEISGNRKGRQDQDSEEGEGKR